MKTILQRLPYGLLYLLILLLPFQTHYLLTVSNANNPSTALKLYGFDLIFLLFSVALLWYWYHYAQPVKLQSFTWICLTLAALAGLSSYWANDRDVSFYYWLHWIAAILLLQAILTLSPKLTVMLSLFTIQGLVQTGFIVWQYVNQEVVANKWLGMAVQLPETSGVPVVLTTAGRFLRAFGTWPHPNTAGGLLVLSLISSVLLWQLLSFSRWRYTVLLSTLIITIGLWFTFSRSAILIWVIGCIGFSIARYKIALPTILSLVLLTILGSIFLPLVQTRLSTAMFTEHLSIEERITQLSDGWELLKKYWPVGTGMGNYTLVAPAVAYPAPVHFTPLLITVELGLLPALILFYLIGVVLYHSWKVNHTIWDSTWLLGSIVMLSVFDHYFWTLPAMLFMGAIVLGLTLHNTNTSDTIP